MGGIASTLVLQNNLKTRTENIVGNVVELKPALSRGIGDHERWIDQNVWSVFM